MALDGGADGLAVLRRAAGGAAGWLAPGGALLGETSERQAASRVAEMSAGGLAARNVHEDDESGERHSDHRRWPPAIPQAA